MDLISSIFEVMDLWGLVFNGVNFIDVNLKGVDLINGLIYLISFNGVNLENVILVEVIMFWIFFKNVKI